MKWQNKESNGISIGGEFYQCDKNGIVDVPREAGDLSQFGFTAHVSEAEIKEKAKFDKENAEASAATDLQNAQVSAELTAAQDAAEKTDATSNDAAAAAVKFAQTVKAPKSK